MTLEVSFYFRARTQYLVYQKVLEEPIITTIVKISGAIDLFNLICWFGLIG